uniref:EOG090X0G5X n=1 Tax=Megafenestra aurita TaxID=2291010 RepID=A0A4Y7NHN6_9CRUS|nr:EOG090X0G5X [Megafenestra aurita]SVE92721.1 EOG090X0G5X [Megafenestra aurita]
MEKTRVTAQVLSTVPIMFSYWAKAADALDLSKLLNDDLAGKSFACAFILLSIMEDYEAILLVKQEVFVFKIPPRTSNRGYRAADWNLAAPDWTGRMRLLAKGTECILKLEDKVTGELFAKCPVDQYPGIAIEAVSDSSRYFVVRIQDDSGRAAFIGVGFADRSDSFDLNVALQDHFKWVKQSQDIEKEGTSEETAKPRLDLSFKAGETIKINMKIGKKDGDSAVKPKAKTQGGLPPPPGGVRLAPPGGLKSNSDGADGAAKPQSEPLQQEVWGDFTSAGPSTNVAAPISK